MRVIKPQRLSVITRPYEVKRQRYLGISTLAFFDLGTSELLTEVAMWQFAADELGKDASLDAGVPKRNAEVLVSGSVHTPGGEPQETCPAVVRLGSIEKTIYAIGDRHWRGEGESWSAPEPFTAMPLAWERAFGGATFPDNPLGKGAAPVETKHGPIRLLPNLELPGHLVQRPKDRPPPAGLGPIDLSWPQRLNKAGTYDQAWLQELFPGAAHDIDWTFWNVAPEDQQQSTSFRGDEPFELRNLHPSRETIRGALPGLVAHTLVRTVDPEGAESTHTLEPRLTTVWLFPHAEVGVLVFQCAVPTREPDGTDVSLLMIAAEKLGQPRGDSHYAAVLEKRLDPDGGVFHALRDEDLVPPELVEVPPGVEVPAMDELIGSSDTLLDRMEEKRHRDLERVCPALIETDDSIEVEPEREMERRSSELEQMLAEAEQTAQPEETQSRTRTREWVLDALHTDESLAFVDLTGVDLSGLDLRGARFADAWLESANLAGSNLDGADFTRAVLARADLSGVSLANASFRGADLGGAALSDVGSAEGLDLTEAILVKADLRRSNLTGAILDGAMLGQSLFEDTLLAVSSSSMTFVETDLRGASFHGARLTKASFVECDLSGVDFGGSTLRRVSIVRGDARNICFEGADTLNLVVCLVGSMEGADLRGASLASANLRGVDLRGADLSGALLDDADLSETDLGGARLHRIVARRARFVRADLREADLTGANLMGADLQMADARGTRLVGTNLYGANFALVRSSETTLLIDALQKNVTIYPLWRESKGLS